MGLNPSCNNVEGTGLEVLGDPPFPADLAERARKELLRVLPEAVFANKIETREVYKNGSKGDRMGRMGITCYYEGQEADIETIEVQDVKATALGWTFRRAWYYWVCTTGDRPVPEAVARELNETWGGQIRVDGYSGGRDVRGDVASYHVDTLEGLNALVAVLRRIGAPQ